MEYTEPLVSSGKIYIDPCFHNTEEAVYKRLVCPVLEYDSSVCDQHLATRCCSLGGIRKCEKL